MRGPGRNPAATQERQMETLDGQRKTLQDRQVRVFIALATLYLAWSSTYLAIRFALDGFPPLFVAGSRYTLVGLGLFVYLRLRGAAGPDRAEWTHASIIGSFLLLGGTGGVVYAIQWVGSGTAALVIATTPLWTVLFAGFWKQWPRGREWLGLAVGFTGIAILNSGGDLRAHPLGAVFLILAAMSWAFGSVLSTRLRLPGGMMSSAAQMFSGGLVVLAAGFASGERVPSHPPLRAAAALVYLAVFGSLLGYTAYTYLLKTVRPSLATSYTYVNPALAVLLGAWLAGELITPATVLALPVILTGVVLVIAGQRRE
jgi:drug/metabolite transporter (DMT)-like permease